MLKATIKSIIEKSVRGQCLLSTLFENSLIMPRMPLQIENCKAERRATDRTAIANGHPS